MTLVLVARRHVDLLRVCSAACRPDPVPATPPR